MVRRRLRRRPHRRRDKALEVAEGAGDLLDLGPLVWAVVKIPFKVVKAVFDVWN